MIKKGDNWRKKKKSDLLEKEVIEGKKKSDLLEKEEIEIKKTIEEKIKSLEIEIKNVKEREQINIYLILLKLC